MDRKETKFPSKLNVGRDRRDKRENQELVKFIVRLDRRRVNKLYPDPVHGALSIKASRQACGDKTTKFKRNIGQNRRHLGRSCPLAIPRPEGQRHTPSLGSSRVSRILPPLLDAPMAEAAITGRGRILYVKSLSTWTSRLRRPKEPIVGAIVRVFTTRDQDTDHA